MSQPVPRPRQAQLALEFPGGSERPGDDPDVPLYDTTFVVVDLETTGGSADGDAITEIGAVKVRGGEVLGEFATLVDPGCPIPPQVVQLTGITTAMVRDAPRIEAVLPGFLEFAAGAVLVAHNARFDTRFLKAAAQQCDLAWPAPPVLCTVQLARRVLDRDEAPSVRLSVLAQLLGSGTRPTHRALDDARATVDVLHALIERVGNLGVHSLAELIGYLPEVTRRQRAKRHLAADLPATPGVYLFRGPGDEVLYIGTAVNLRRRVHSYFTGSDTRTRMREMVALATRVDHVECAHGLEAGVRELRLLVAHTPPYNRRSKFPRRAWWLTLTDEAFPRFTTTRTPTPDTLGPFNSRSHAVAVADTLADWCGIRTCTTRIPRTGRHGPDCPPATVGGCPASVFGKHSDATEYAIAPNLVRDLFAGRTDTPLHTMRQRIENLAATEQFEAAARLRDRTLTVIRALRRTQRLAALARLAEFVAARPDGAGGWEFAVVRYGRLAAAGTAPRGTRPMPVVDALTASAEAVIGPPVAPPRDSGHTSGSLGSRSQVPPEERTGGSFPGSYPCALEIGRRLSGSAAGLLDGVPGGLGDICGRCGKEDDVRRGWCGAEGAYPPLRGASPEETGLIVRWLAQPGVRIVRTTEGYAEPRLGAGRWGEWAALAAAAHADASDSAAE
ncbi:DEDD exonuclease domain-containing protein [Nocardia sp. alder85J]|uniref:DEDD exonuclease domain-containing protein n=1 Tax=Nocardia sp. alder85J TaxID=2862949 RepID=UPI001CD7D044|nr:DEDD exonuclease domain-containing protein [Nocardia sp. alder85J]MCX4098730.1 DEDD exonuclease domain-containing protein [Nocardia sp. alder85J]